MKVSNINKIPKIVHYCWLSDNPIPPDILRYMESWKVLENEGYKFIKWDCNNFDLNSHPWAKGAFEAKKYAFAADEVRLYALYNYGGIYLDMDVEVIKSFDTLLDSDIMIATEFDNYGIEAGCMGSKKNNLYIKECLDYFKNKSFEQREVLPIIMRRIMEKSFPELVPSLKTKDYFTAKDYYTGQIKKTKNTFTIHNYAGSWKEVNDSDKILVKNRWMFFSNNKDTEYNIKFYKNFEKCNDSLRKLASACDNKEKIIMTMKDSLTENVSSKTMLKIIFKRQLSKILTKFHNVKVILNK